VWTQQGLKLVGTGAVGTAQQGISVSLSGDSTTAIVGGNKDNSSAGAVWIFAVGSGAIPTLSGWALLLLSLLLSCVAFVALKRS
jgi:hypothetical protein